MSDKARRLMRYLYLTIGSGVGFAAAIALWGHLKGHIEAIVYPAFITIVFAAVYLMATRTERSVRANE